MTLVTDDIDPTTNLTALERAEALASVRKLHALCRETNDAHNAEMTALAAKRNAAARRTGMKPTALALELGITKARAHQILHGI